MSSQPTIKFLIRITIFSLIPLPSQSPPHPLLIMQFDHQLRIFCSFISDNQRSLAEDYGWQNTTI